MKVYDFKEECKKRNLNKYVEIEWRESMVRMGQEQAKHEIDIAKIVRSKKLTNKIIGIVGYGTAGILFIMFVVAMIGRILQ